MGEVQEAVHIGRQDPETLTQARLLDQVGALRHKAELLAQHVVSFN